MNQSRNHSNSATSGSHRVLALGLCTALAVTTAVGATGCSTDSSKPSTVSDADKSETVYVKADANGKAKEITVQTDLKNKEISDSKKIKDYSNLKEIKNTDGDEEFTQDTQGNLLWDNNGEDIHYEGTSTDELPVDVAISYYLDGKKMDADELAGKSGELRIRFDYDNTTEETVKVNGKETKTQVPFAVISALMLSEDNASDVKVTNGKVISMEGQYVVIGYACPGLEESLKLTDYEPTKDISLPEYVEVTADVTDFELDFTATVISSGLFDELENDDLDDLNDTADSLEKLGDASKELADGAAQLLSGSDTYRSYLNEYIDGVSELSSGTDSLNTGIQTLNSQKEQLLNGAGTLQSGLENLNSALADASAKLGTAGSEDASANAALLGSLNELQNQTASVSDALSSFDQTLSEVEAQINAINWDQIKTAITDEARKNASSAAQDAIASSVEGAVDQAIAQAASDGTELTEEERASIAAQIKEELNSSLSASVSNSINQNLALTDSIQSVDTIKSSMDAALSSLKGTVSTLKDLLPVINTGAQSYSALAAQFSSITDTLGTLSSAISQLSQGSAQLTDGISAFNHGIGQLSTGADALNTGASTLASAGNELKNGYNTLAEGISALSEGMTLFDKDGIQELKKLGGSDLRELSDRIKAVRDADAKYDNYGGKLKNQTSEVHFIIETDSIEK